MSKPKKFLTHLDGKPAAKQHEKPCSDCPFRRDAVPGWLAGNTPEAWMQMAHGETQFDCHVLLGQQCAGSAIYRGNVCKRPWDKRTLVLEPNRTVVFSTPMEFLEHHNSLAALAKSGASQ